MTNLLVPRSILSYYQLIFASKWISAKSEGTSLKK